MLGKRNADRGELGVRRKRSDESGARRTRRAGEVK